MKNENQSNENLPEKKSSKKEKQIKAKKLPGILKKVYTKKKLEKLLNRIYVPEEKIEVEKLFVPHPKKAEKFYIPKDFLIEKRKFNKIKKIGKDVASQKFSFKIIPFVAVIAFFSIITVFVSLFKNPITKKVLINVMQSSFGAKTEIEYVNVKFFDSSIFIKGISQGYKTDPMKNLFVLDSVTLDFNLTQLLRGKFDLENISVEGLDVMTPRKTSAALPAKEKKQKPEEKSFLQVQFEEKSKIAEQAAKDELDKLFAQYNPTAILDSLQNKLESPAVAKEVYLLGDELVNRWKNEPVEIATQVTDFSNKVTKFANQDFSKLSNPVEIKNFIQEITSILQDGKALSEKTTKIVNDVKSDSEKIKNASTKVQNAIKKDSQFAENEINKIKNFSIQDGVRILTGPIDTILYKTIGKYYPYIKKGLSLALDAKEKSAAKPKSPKKSKDENAKKATHKRSEGQNIYYRKNTIPKFIIEKISFSSKNFSALATDISSDMNVRGKPAFANFKLNVFEQNHKGDVTVDLRSQNKNQIVDVNYFGDNYPISFEVPQFAVSSASEISGKINILQNGAFLVEANLGLKNLSFKTQSFEPQFAYDLYSRALSKLKNVNVGLGIEILNDEKFDLKISTDADKQIAKILSQLVNEELESLKQNAMKQITKLLDEQTGGATSKIKEFIDIENGLNSESIKVDKLNQMLESKKIELQKKLEATAQQAAKSALENAFGNNLLQFKK